MKNEPQTKNERYRINMKNFLGYMLEGILLAAMIWGCLYAAMRFGFDALLKNIGG